MQQLGLNLDRYLPNLSVLVEKKTWEDCVSPEACKRLLLLWTEEVAMPLNDLARRVPHPQGALSL